MPRASQQRGKEFFLFKPVSMFFAHQLYEPGPGGYYYFIKLQADVGANVEKITNPEQAAAREDFARPSKKRQRQRKDDSMGKRPNQAV